MGVSAGVNGVPKPFAFLTSSNLEQFQIAADIRSPVRRARCITHAD